MYIRHIKIDHIRSINSLTWSLPDSVPSAGWHVIVGDNGSGKSSFLRSVALAMMGPKEAAGLRQSWDDFLSKDEERGAIDLEIARNRKIDEVTKKELGRAGHYRIQLSFQVFSDLDATVGFWSGDPGKNNESPIWDDGRGWFCAAYGPFRRLTGGDVEFERLSRRLPRLARFLSIFDERVALTDCLEWLQDLKFKQLEEREKKPRSEEDFLDRITRFINQPDFLPFQARLVEVSSKRVVFRDGNDKEVPIEELSDGYRSILSLTFELIRQLSVVYGEGAVFDPDDPGKVVCEGVVLIDEIDVHLHPTWQRRIGLWFRKHFPKMQFLVTTHSPLICQAADVGTVFRLPRPGVAEAGGMVEGTQLQRLLFGNVLDAYGTEVFGPDVTRSEQSKVMSSRLAELNVKEVREGLTSAEKKERDRLRAAMPSEALSLE
jgi:predicted ATP-dependent endonuclease of OLD family